MSSIGIESGCKKSVEFPIGGLWENEEFKIEIDCELKVQVSAVSRIAPCPHCTIKYENRHGYVVWVCPAVVIAVNEGGFNSTGVCAHCIIAAMESINLKGKP